MCARLYVKAMCKEPCKFDFAMVWQGRDLRMEGNGRGE